MNPNVLRTRVRSGTLNFTSVFGTSKYLNFNGFFRISCFMPKESMRIARFFMVI